jgi:hypothetical protein
VQPCNRGTAPGVLLPLVAILDRDPEAVVLLLPSDHFVADEPALARSLRAAHQAAHCGWTDLGTPERVRRCLARASAWPLPGSRHGTTVNLAATALP